MHKLVKKGQNGISFRDPNYKITLSDEQKAYLNRPTEENYNRQLNDIKIKERNQTNYNRFSNVMGAAGGLFSGFYDAIPTADDDINGTDQNVAQLRGKTAQAMMQSGNPWLMAAGATVGVLDKTGAFGDASEGLGGATDFGNAVASYLLPGVGWWGKSTDNYKMSEALGSASSYGDSRTYAEKAQKNAGAKLLFGRKRANNMIQEAQRQDNQIQGVLSQAKDDFAIQNNMSEINGLRIQNITSGGNQMMRAAKSGMKTPTQEEVKKRVEAIKKKRNQKKINLDPFATLEDFTKYLEDKGLLSNDYDYVKFYGDKPLFEEWKNDTNPNKHFSDKYKKPNHITFSEESIYSTPQQPGGKWYKDANGKTHFKPSDWQKQAISYEAYKNYFDRNEPDVILDYETTQKFQNGGQMNVIPEGALHARLHHMEDENPDLKGQITKKGIPVVSEEEGGEITQQAEIEREEIIFNKDTTTALEELYEKYKEDPKPEYAIYAGKILAQQIMENTDDRTGLIDRVE